MTKCKVIVFTLQNDLADSQQTKRQKRRLITLLKNTERLKMVKKGLLSEEDYSLTCIVCGTQEKVSLVPHRVNNKVAGIYCFCDKCFPQYAGATLRTEWIKDDNEVNPEAFIQSLNLSTIDLLNSAIAWIKTKDQEGALDTAIETINAAIKQIRT